MRSGNSYLSALHDQREVYLDGALVSDVVAHPAFAPIAHTVAGLYDLAADPANRMIYIAPETGREANVAFNIPRSLADLEARSRAIDLWAGHTHGWVGRGPAHTGAFLAAFAAHPEQFSRTPPHDFGANAVACHRRLLDESLFAVYAIVPPQVSRADSAHSWEGEYIQAGVVDETSSGIVVRGAQMLATSAAVADELFLSVIRPLKPEDQVFAVSFVIPIATRGLKLYCRRPYATGATSSYDYPLSTRYDETDALVIFDDVLVPWDRVLVNRDVRGLQAQFYATGAHLLGNHQALRRLIVKLQFILGLALKATATNGSDRIPGVREKLGELASLASLVESGVLAGEYRSAPDSGGMWLPNARAIYGVVALQAEIYPRVLHIVRDLVGGGVLQLPSSVKDMQSPLTRRDIDRYIQSPGTPAEERVKLFKLIWDAIGSEFAGRNVQYEMFYAGAPFAAKGYIYRSYGFDGVLADVERFLASYGSRAPVARCSEHSR